MSAAPTPVVHERWVIVARQQWGARTMGLYAVDIDDEFLEIVFSVTCVEV